MVKTIVAAVALLSTLFVAPPARAAAFGYAKNTGSVSAGQINPCGVGVYCGNLVNASLAGSNTFLLDLSQYGATRLSVQTNFSSVTFSNASISDGQKCTANLTVASNAGIINPGVTLTACGRSFVSGTDFSPNVTYSSMTAKAIKDALTAASACSGLAFSQRSGTSIVYTTSTLNSATACDLASTNYAYISTAATTAGVNGGFTLGSAQITKTNHGFVSGLGVLYSSAAANTIIGGLTNQTTYYVYKVSDSYFQLMATKADALLGANGITVTSTNTNTTANTFTLAPLAWSGSATFLLQVSNDNSSWATAPSTGTVTATNATGATTLVDDFGVLGYRYLRLNYTTPTQGALSLVAPVVLRP